MYYTKTTHYRADGTIERIQEYDTNENIIKSTTYYKDGEIDDWWEFEYDSDGRKTKSTNYDADGTIKEVNEY